MLERSVRWKLLRPPSPGRSAAALITLALCLASPSASAAGEAVEVWTRGNGNHSIGGKVDKLNRRTVVLNDLKLEERTGPDAQVGAERSYRGARLISIMQAAGSQPGDQLLLRFANGMMVPVPRAALKDLDLFVAVAVKGRDGKWTTQFPSVKKSAEVSVDPRPVTFGANKLVAKSRRLPGLLKEDGEEFSPWKYVDSLVAIEVVSQAAWEAQFDAPRPAKADMVDLVARGQQVYLRACQYCHGSRDVGATYGWDFLVPLPMHSIKKPRDLYQHVTMAPYDKIESGELMPEQKLTKRDVAAVWAWNKMLSLQDHLGAYKTGGGAGPKKAPKRTR